MTINLSFYRFAGIDDPDALADSLRESCAEHNLLGKIVVAPEGINGMVAGTDSDVAAWGDWLHSDARFADLRLKPSPGDEVPYGKLVVKVKPEIVTMRVDGVDAVSKTGRHLPPEKFRDWLRAGEDMMVIDVRNDYEYDIGHFKGAVDPKTEYFHQFPDWVHENRELLEQQKHIVMYCTGGIRCEKATAWMIDQGFDNMWQIQGGIHTYFELVEDAHKDWDGEMFVFDERVAVDTQLNETSTELCSRCGDPVVGGDESQCPRCRD